MTTAIVDVEGNGLLPELTNMWCVIVNPLYDNTPMKHYVVFVPKEHLMSFTPGKLTVTPDKEALTVRPLEEFKEYAKTNITHWVGHNLINYDSRALKKLNLVEDIPIKDITDTLVLSQITQPSRKGGHSLASWGMRFNDYKGDWKDFSAFSWDMVNYCLQDVRITRKLYAFMLENIRNFSKFSIRLEHAMRTILDEMEDNGFALDQERAHLLYLQIKKLCEGMEEKIQKDFPPEKVYFKKLYPRFNKSTGGMHGQDAKTLENYRYDKEVDEQDKEYYHLFTMQTFNPRSTTQIIQRMNQLGWNPVVFNDPTDNQLVGAAAKHLKMSEEEIEKLKKELSSEEQKQSFVRKAEAKGFDVEEIKGSPQVCEENFETLPEDAPESAKNIAEWFLLDKRLQKLDEWFREVNPKTGCIHGQVFSCGAKTHRMSHRNPNIANISRIYTSEKKFDSREDALNFISSLENEHDLVEFKDRPDDDGKWNVQYVVWGLRGRFATDMRACWTVRDLKKRCLVGVDLSGIQLRAFAYYADNKEYTDLILKGDIHSYNRDVLVGIIEKYCSSTNITTEKVDFLRANNKEKRNFSKTFIYAFLLGAGNKKTGSIFGFPAENQFDAGKYIQENFKKEIEGLQEIEKKKSKWAKAGYMVGLDGRLIAITSKHFALSVALQSFEAIVMKYAIVLAQRKIKENRLDAKLVVICHDEVQYDCLKEHAEQVGKLVVTAMEEAGSFFQKKVPITGEYKTNAKNWAESH